jgi:hypothetical protein
MTAAINRAMRAIGFMCGWTLRSTFSAHLTDSYIHACCREAARLLSPSGYLMRWVDTFTLCEARHLPITDAIKPVDLIAWDSLRMGNGYRSRLTQPGDLVVDPAAGSFVVMRAAHQLGRNFIGCDLKLPEDEL